MKKRNQKRGFTIVELVVVVTVIAILSAVLIPTFAGIINRSRETADKQAVREMNAILAELNETEKVTTLSTAIALFNERSITLEDYRPMSKNHYFYFTVDAEGNGTIIFANDKNEVVFPEDYSGTAQWMSLSGEVPVDDNYKIAGAGTGTVTIDSGAKLVHLMDAIKNDDNSVEDFTEIVITLGANVDLKGAAMNFGTTDKTITLKDGNLSGVRVTEEAYSPTTGEFADDLYGFGVFGNITSGTVTVQNVTFKNLVIGNAKTTHAEGANTIGILAGYVGTNAKLVVRDVTIEGCEVHGYQKVGGLVGQLLGELEVDGLTMKNTTIEGHTEVAKLAGFAPIGYASKLTVANATFENVKVSSYADGQVKKTDLTNPEQPVLGPDANTFIPSGSDIFPAATQDFAWYDSYDAGKYFDVTVSGQPYEGTQAMSSTSQSFDLN